MTWYLELRRRWNRVTSGLRNSRNVPTRLYVVPAELEMKFLCSLLTLPLIAQQSVNFYSVEKERALGRQLASEIRRQSEPLARDT